MCHRRGDWSRTSSKASEPEEQPEEKHAWLPSRAKDLLVTYVSGGATESTDETPEHPAVEADSETPTAEPTESEVSDEIEESEDEREEDPIPAD